ncbi:hypothetical protein [Maribacter antarcticus]|uniref:hypothetical protein n=1 Tax=Maribacter antarcticus TaxID=505250 RepID=UPI00047E1132|nr:hypothetical protein [Maribacter antarcticus]
MCFVLFGCSRDEPKEQIDEHQIYLTVLAPVNYIAENVETWIITHYSSGGVLDSKKLKNGDRFF